MFIYLLKIGANHGRGGLGLSPNPSTLHYPLPAGAGSWAERRATETQGKHLPLPRNKPRPLVSYYESAGNLTSPWKKGLNQSGAPFFSPTSCTGKRRTRTETVSHQSPSVARQTSVKGAEPPVHQSGSKYDTHVISVRVRQLVWLMKKTEGSLSEVLPNLFIFIIIATIFKAER